MHTFVATMPGSGPSRHRPGPLVAGVRGVGEFAGGTQRLPPVLPLLFEHGKPIDQEVGERRPLEQARSAFGWRVVQQSQTLPRQLALFLVLGEVEARRCVEDMSMHTRSIRSPAARDRRMSPRVSKVVTAPAMALRLASRASANSAMLCSRGSQTARYPSRRPTIGAIP